MIPSLVRWVTVYLKIYTEVMPLRKGFDFVNLGGTMLFARKS
jgi:hypothetical protein